MVNKMYKVSDARQAPEARQLTASKHNQVLMSIVVCMPVLSYGTAMGWISPHKALLTGAGSPATPPLTEQDVSWLASVMFLSAPPAVFLFGAAADRFGRKRALLAATLPIAAGWALKLGGAAPMTLIAARALIGLGSGGAFVVCPLYVKEISEDAIRGMTGTFLIFSQTAGNLLVFTLGDLLPYRAVLALLLALPLAHFLALLWLPDTPDCLVKRGQTEEAARVLGWLRSLPADHRSVREELTRLEAEQNSSELKFSPRLLFSERTTRQAFCVALTVNLAREFCGCIAVLVYASHVFSAAAGADTAAANATGYADADAAASVGLTPNQQSILLAAVQIVGSFVACQLVDRVGRKPLLAGTSALAGASLAALAAWFALAQGAAGWLPVAALCCCIFADAAGLQPLPFVVMTEMFSFQLRGMVATLIMAISLGTDFLLLRGFLTLSAAAGWPGTFALFATVSFGTLLYVTWCVPETARRPLASIYSDLARRHGNAAS